jgi:hypothetical protein
MRFLVVILAFVALSVPFDAQESSTLEQPNPSIMS